MASGLTAAPGALDDIDAITRQCRVFAANLQRGGKRRCSNVAC